MISHLSFFNISLTATCFWSLRHPSHLVPGWRQGPWDRQHIRQNIAQSTVLLYLSRDRRSSPTEHLQSCKGGKPCSKAQWAQGSRDCNENKCIEAGHGMVWVWFNGWPKTQNLCESLSLRAPLEKGWDGSHIANIKISLITLTFTSSTSHSFQTQLQSPKASWDIKHIIYSDLILLQ